ncbi:MAG: hypothetical protein RL148_2856 [Planctomycetota bacterium]
MSGSAEDRGWRSRALFWGPVAPLVALDLWSKAWSFARLETLYPGAPVAEESIWRGFVSFSLVNWTNTGTVWGLGQGMTVPLIVLRCLALVLLVWFARRTAVANRVQLLVLGLILAGALGNLYDNLTQPNRAVRDFLLFFHGEGAERIVFPAFNVADSCITVGAIGLFILLMREDRASSARKPAVS